MKMEVNGKCVCTLKQWEIDLVKYVLTSEGFEEDMCRRAAYYWTHKVDQCYAALEKEWIPLLQKDPAVTMMPASREAFFSMIKARPDYKDRDAKDAANKPK